MLASSAAALVAAASGRCRRSSARAAPASARRRLTARLAEGEELAAPETPEEQPIFGSGRLYRVIFKRGIGLRKEPDIDADRSGKDLTLGEFFEVKSEVRRGGRRYFELEDGRGWAFDWAEVDGEKVELVELAPLMYTASFKKGVTGLTWSSDFTMKYTKVKGFTDPSFQEELGEVGVRKGDVLVMVDRDPVIGMPMGQVLERLWATRGQQPGSGVFYRVVTDSPYGIGIRSEPEMNASRMGVDLPRGSIFQADEVWENPKDGITYLHLADNRGWVYDNTTVDPENPTVEKVRGKAGKCVLTLWRGKLEELAETLNYNFLGDALGEPCTITVYDKPDGEPKYVLAKTGTNLRQVLVDNEFEVHNDPGSRLFNCSSQNLCGTCTLQVVKGMENASRMSVNEAKAMSANPDGFRLCCGTDIYGDLTVRLRPKGVQFMGGTSAG